MNQRPIFFYIKYVCVVCVIGTLTATGTTCHQMNRLKTEISLTKFACERERVPYNYSRKQHEIRLSFLTVLKLYLFENAETKIVLNRTNMYLNDHIHPINYAPQIIRRRYFTELIQNLIVHTICVIFFFFCALIQLK